MPIQQTKDVEYMGSLRAKGSLKKDKVDIVAIEVEVRIQCSHQEIEMPRRDDREEITAEETM
jgi:hypothetical protein